MPRRNIPSDLSGSDRPKQVVGSIVSFPISFLVLVSKKSLATACRFDNYLSLG